MGGITLVDRKEAEQSLSPAEQRQFALSARRALDAVEKSQSPTQPQAPSRHEARLEPGQTPSLVDLLKKENMPLQAESANFKIYATHPALANVVLTELEKARKEIAVALTGEELAEWSTPCEVYVSQARQDRGATLFYPKTLSDEELDTLRNTENLDELRTRFRDLSEPAKVEMAISGSSLQSIRENIIPHEVSHTITRYHLEVNPPRWADEGIASYREGNSMKTSIRGSLMRAYADGRAIPIQRLVDTLEYPSGEQATWDFYCQGMALSEFLIRQQGMREFIDMLKQVSDEEKGNLDAKHSSLLESAIAKRYGYQNFDSLNEHFSRWVRDGCPRIVLDGGQEKSSLPGRYLAK